MSRRAAAKTVIFGLRRLAVVAWPRPSARPLDRLAREVAERCVEPTLRRLGPAQMNRMGLAELRGYARARAASPVGLLVREYVSQKRVTGAAERELTARALERTVHAAVHELTQQRAVTLAAPFTRPQRRAA